MSLRINSYKAFVLLGKEDIILSESNEKFQILNISDSRITLISCDEEEAHIKSVSVEIFLNEEWYFSPKKDISL